MFRAYFSLALSEGDAELPAPEAAIRAGHVAPWPSACVACRAPLGQPLQVKRGASQPAEAGANAAYLLVSPMSLSSQEVPQEHPSTVIDPVIGRGMYPCREGQTKTIKSANPVKPNQEVELMGHESWPMTDLIGHG